MRLLLEKYGNWMALGLLLLFWWRLLSAATTQSVTFDEILHILHGALYWQVYNLYSVVQNPPLIHAIMGAPVTVLFQPTLPANLGSDLFQDWLPISQAFMWQLNDNGLEILWGGRLATMFLATLLGAILYRWGRELFANRTAALLGLLLYTLDPNILAHSHLATTDLGATFFIFLAAYLVWRYWQLSLGGREGQWSYLAAGVAIGAAFAAKFSGVILIPALLLLAGYRLWVRPVQQPSLRRTFMEIVGWLFIGSLLFLAVYRFQLGALAVDFAVQREHQLTGHSAFLLGEVSRDGWWYYFPVLFLTKTPVVSLVFIVTSLLLYILRWPWAWSRVWLLLLAGGIVAAGMTSRVNIGYRYLLPVLPLLYLFTGHLAAPSLLKFRAARWGIGLALLLVLTETLWIHPHYLAYFNQLAGGPANGWRVAVDSNLDWGQDVQLLAQTQQARGWPPLRASWLGTAPPAVYGLEAELLPGWPWLRPDPLNDDFYPDWPAPGLYALSATQLHGVYLAEPNPFRWFQEQVPTMRVGYSFFVYDVPAVGLPATVALSGIGLPMLAEADFTAVLGSNQVRPLWYDARTSFLWPAEANGRAWLAVGDGHWPDHPALQALYPVEAERRGERTVGEKTWHYSLFQSSQPAADLTAKQPVESPAVFDGTLQLLGYQPLWTAISVGHRLELLSYWRVVQPPTADLTVFIHLLNEKGELVAQHDGLDVAMRHLQTGDELAQLHTIPLPADLPPGNYSLRIGLYQSDTLHRLSVMVAGESADSLLLQTITHP
jgi:4-amino-4-deoxy-L-arabinose transferase-like glycosyltransferase